MNSSTMNDTNDSLHEMRGKSEWKIHRCPDAHVPATAYLRMTSVPCAVSTTSRPSQIDTRLADERTPFA